jgi:hypothetical protein
MVDLDKDEYKIDIHHIFPRAWCSGQKIPPKTYNSIINKTAISYKANRMIGGKAPSAYLGQIEKVAKISPDKMEKILESHFIDPSLLRADKFDAFYQARKTALLELIAKVMGKSLLPVGTEQPVEDSDEDEDDEATES